MRQIHFKTLLETLATLAIIVAASTVTWDIVTQRRLSIVRAASDTPAAAAENVASRNLKISFDGLMAGDPSNTRMALIEFSDFECPFCAKHASETLPRLKSELVDAGRLLYVFRHFPLETLHRNARYAAAAAACAASSGKFWDMHRLLFANQRGLNRDNVLSYLAEIDAKNECADKADFEVARDVAEGERLGVSSTPTFFIGEVTSKDEIAIRVKFSGAYPFTVISAEIDKLVAAKN